MNRFNEGEVPYNPEGKLPKDISEEFYNKYKEFLDEDKTQIKRYFSELLSFKRPAFNIEIGAPVRIIDDLNTFLNSHNYLTYYYTSIVIKGDENKECFPQELFDRYPHESIGWTEIYITLREEFIHLAYLIDRDLLICNMHKPCDVTNALRGLLFGYNTFSVIGFIDNKTNKKMRGLIPKCSNK